MSNENNTFIFFAAVGTLLVVAVIGVMLWVQNMVPGQGTTNTGTFNFHSGRRIKLTAAGPASAAEATPVDLEQVIAAINKGGCTACHTIPNIPNAVGQVGPNLSNIGVEAATRREGYTAQEYIRESLEEPNAFTAPECPLGPCVAGTMPQLTLNDSEIDLLVNYLSTLGVEQQQ